jgi:hypothetical protein
VSPLSSLCRDDAVSLSIDGVWTAGSRALFEGMSSYLLSTFLPPQFKAGVEEGLTESVTGRPSTNWRKPSEPLARVLAGASPFGSGTGD